MIIHYTGIAYLMSLSVTARSPASPLPVLVRGRSELGRQHTRHVSRVEGRYAFETHLESERRERVLGGDRADGADGREDERADHTGGDGCPRRQLYVQRRKQSRRGQLHGHAYG